MSTRKFARWLRAVARWSHAPEVSFSVFARLDDRSCLVRLGYGGGTARIRVEAGTPIRQVYADLDEFVGRLAVASVSIDRARRDRHRAAYAARPNPN